MGKANILVAGKTGVGKSTLIDSIFNKDLALTGKGKFITQNIKEYSEEDYPVSIIDTMGLDSVNYKMVINNIKIYIEERRKSFNGNEHVHFAWVCIYDCGEPTLTSWYHNDSSEKELIEMLSKYIPVIVVLTKSLNNDNYL